MSNEITEDECKFCNPELKKHYDLNIVCDKYIEYVRGKYHIILNNY